MAAEGVTQLLGVVNKLQAEGSLSSLSHNPELMRTISDATNLLANLTKQNTADLAGPSQSKLQVLSEKEQPWQPSSESRFSQQQGAPYGRQSDYAVQKDAPKINSSFSISNTLQNLRNAPSQELSRPVGSTRKRPSRFSDAGPTVSKQRKGDYHGRSFKADENQYSSAEESTSYNERDTYNSGDHFHEPPGRMQYKTRNGSYNEREKDVQEKTGPYEDTWDHNTVNNQSNYKDQYDQFKYEDPKSFVSRNQGQNNNVMNQDLGYGHNYDTKDHSKNDSGNQDHDSRSQGQNYDSRDQGRNYDSRGQGQNYDSRGQGQDYDSIGQGQNYDSIGQGQNYDSIDQTQNYDTRDQTQNYDSKEQGQRYDSSGQGQRYDSGGQGQSYDSSGQGKSYDSKCQAQRYDSRGQGQKYDSGAQGQKYDSGAQGQKYDSGGRGHDYSSKSQGSRSFDQSDGNNIRSKSTRKYYSSYDQYGLGDQNTHGLRDLQQQQRDSDNRSKHSGKRGRDYIAEQSQVCMYVSIFPL